VVAVQEVATHAVARTEELLEEAAADVAEREEMAMDPRPRDPRAHQRAPPQHLAGSSPCHRACQTDGEGALM
jgi:hypothetical protein